MTHMSARSAIHTPADCMSNLTTVGAPGAGSKCGVSTDSCMVHARPTVHQRASCRQKGDMREDICTMPDFGYTSTEQSFALSECVTALDSSRVRQQHMKEYHLKAAADRTQGGRVETVCIKGVVRCDKCCGQNRCVRVWPASEQ